MDNIKDEPDKPVLCLDSDNFYMDNVVNKWNGKNKVFTVNDENTNPIYSYINEKNGKIIDIQEKHRILILLVREHMVLNQKINYLNIQIK